MRGGCTIICIEHFCTRGEKKTITLLEQSNKNKHCAQVSKQMVSEKEYSGLGS